MRRLSKTEKLIIKELNSHRNGNTLINLLGGISKDMVLDINRKTNEVTAIAVNYETGRPVDQSGLDDFFIKRIYFINTLLKLLVYLEKEGYILTYLISNTHDDKRLIGDLELVEQINSSRTKTITYKFDNDFVINSLVNYRDPIIISTEELKNFERENFKTQEQIRFKKTYVISIVAIVISFLIGISSLWISIYSLRKPLRINQNQLDSITIRLDRITAKEDTIISLNKIEIDTTANSKIPASRVSVLR